jgi:hypothetical protein
MRDLSDSSGLSSVVTGAERHGTVSVVGDKCEPTAVLPRI